MSSAHKGARIGMSTHASLDQVLTSQPRWIPGMIPLASTQEAQERYHLAFILCVDSVQVYVQSRSRKSRQLIQEICKTAGCHPPAIFWHASPCYKMVWHSMI